MKINDERIKFFKSGKTGTEISIDFYNKYYNTLFKIAEDLENTNTKQIIIESFSVKVVTNDEIIISIPENDIGVIGQNLILPKCENNEHEAILNILNAIAKEKDKFVFFDIGANVGIYSLLLNKKFKNCEIHAFEPGEKTFKNLIKNIKENNANNIIANNFGLYDNICEKEFFFCDNLITASSMADTVKGVKKTKMICKFDTLDNYCRNKIQPDFIKCDVEGAEFFVVKGGINVLKETKPVLMMELLRKWSKCFNYHPNDVIDFFKQINYKCFVASDKYLKCVESINEDTVETNYFFLHEEKHNDLINKLQQR